MLEINITVSCPDLVQAATILAAAMAGTKIGEPAIPTPTAAPTATNTSGATQPAQCSAVTPVAAQLPALPVTQTAPVNPVTANPTNGHPSTTSTMPSCPSSAVPVSAVPLAQAPSFTLEQVSKAGANLITAQPAKMQELVGLMAQFGVQTVNALRPDQLGAFATALRGMGAQI